MSLQSTVKSRTSESCIDEQMTSRVENLEKNLVRDESGDLLTDYHNLL
jgi:hypothetical protein